jgi:hypothetical protein
MTDHLSWETLNDLVDGVVSRAAATAVATRDCACAGAG